MPFRGWRRRRSGFSWKALLAPTYFEAMTAAAFLAFAERGVEVAVLEVGMGGRFDATNIAPCRSFGHRPIGFDHERFLGGTIAAIAGEKAAIIKEGRPVVVGRLEPEALEVVRREAKIEERSLDLRPRGDRRSVARNRAEARESGSRLLRATTAFSSFRLAGEHQLDNLALAVRAVECFSDSLSVESVARGVAATEWPGRLQRIEGKPALLLDAAHNVMASRGARCGIWRRIRTISGCCSSGS